MKNYTTVMTQYNEYIATKQLGVSFMSFERVITMF